MLGQKQSPIDQTVTDQETGEVFVPRWIIKLNDLQGYDITKPLPHELIIDFDQRICVAGTRLFNDVELFEMLMDDEAVIYKSKGNFLFVSGAARTGADRLVINWCIKRGYPYVEYEADWDTHGKSAGYIRNAEMGKILTHLSVFWDGVSKGTTNMIEVAEAKNVRPHKYLVSITQPPMSD
jgi:hypothetical protein